MAWLGKWSLAAAISAPVLAAALIGVGTASGAGTDEDAAKSMLKAMSDYLASQKTIAFDFDTNLGIVTADQQKIDLASSGQIVLNRPDKIMAVRKGGFADVALTFDGKTLTVLNKTANLYAQGELPGTVDHLIDELRDTDNRPVPGANLLFSNVYDQLMPGVLNVKDLGSGVIGGVECDHLAFRNDQVDWQIWIAQGSQPYPCRLVITSKQVAGFPDYSVELKNWKTGSAVASVDFSFKNATNAKMADLKDLPDADELPDRFRVAGGAK